ncbi:hypothetical protein NQ117_13930 [Paenibacillus sp. SC116]|uniref:hypothetical protein n=1 Tax=Paenibacillus sp. SC116 TaxID=2968986 RepID=UPI00215AFB34|nr:hypothetical protein [Paenibacillus sp. SC116]MCR8844786.1 hypothetical protein [Paenibacillus sp. SC116]
MTKKFKLGLTVAAIGAILITSSLVGSNRTTLHAQPGDSQDPLVTKSYVDKQIDALKAEIGKGSGSSTGGSKPPTGNDKPTTESSAMKIVTIKPGQMLIGKAGAEFVVRAGKSTIYSSDASGVSDLTEGKDLTNGMTVANNHLLLFPRDGRGITASDTPKNQVVVAVRGGYEVKQIPVEEQAEQSTDSNSNSNA